MVGITTMWTYRDKLVETPFGMSLQAYSQALHKWVHIAYFTPAQIKEAKTHYEEVMRYLAVNPKHLDFSFNNLLEIERILETEMDTDIYVELLNMLTRIQAVLNIRTEVLD